MFMCKEMQAGRQAGSRPARLPLYYMMMHFFSLSMYDKAAAMSLASLMRASGDCI